MGEIGGPEDQGSLKPVVQRHLGKSFHGATDVLPFVEVNVKKIVSRVIERAKWLCISKSTFPYERFIVTFFFERSHESSIATLCNLTKIAGLQITESSDSGITWVKKFSIGSIVKGKIQEIKELGAVSFKDHSNILGFITQYQLGGKNVEEGSVVEAVVLDINKLDGLVDLSLRSELFSKTKDVKSDSLESKKIITQKLPDKQFTNGQRH
ncbi:hypothetical protein QJS10_CPA06g01037 [Acorus calamus]|uniref:S1 motif domain-containing protein n=1 Tax=Acorus calamus TaxID=4465 RepID=A0AAV9ENJ1_ACOCL|nr:hypothetical protein QJS10_CPA06g01037 [Acorus calamus]